MSESAIEWRDVPGYEGHYQVSNTGQVYSLKSNKAMKQCKVTGGYYAVMFWLNGIGKMHTVHSLVALAFIGERPPDYYTHHKNEIKTDNRVENLEYMLASEHTRMHVIGEKSTRTILTADKVRQIRELRKSGKKRRELAKMFGVAPATINNVVSRKNSWLHVE